MRLFSNKWLIRAHDERAERELVASLGLRPLTARLLTARGLTEPAAVSSFIKKTDLRFYDPFLLTDMDKAVSRIEQAIRTGERICIYGDYDVDGVTSTTVLYTYLTSRGARCTYFIPDRLSEGYGLSRAAIERLAPDVDLIITVDTGITAAEETAFAASLGVDMIITDHHSCRPVLPQAAAVVNPHRPDSAYPFLQLAGVGVVFKLLCALEGDTEAVCRRFARPRRHRHDCRRDAADGRKPPHRQRWPRAFAPDGKRRPACSDDACRRHQARAACRSASPAAPSAMCSRRG